MKKIQVPTELSTYIQRLQFETDARSNLCAVLLRQGVQNDAFDDYHNQYLEFYNKYELAKQELENEYVMPYLPADDNTYNWTLDFKSSQVIINGIT